MTLRFEAARIVEEEMNITKAGSKRLLSVLLPFLILGAAALVMYFAAPLREDEAARESAAVEAVSQPADQSAPAAEEPVSEPVRRGLFAIHPTDLKALSKIVKNVWAGFDDDASVPAFAPLSIPKGISDLPAKKRKELFILSLLPHVVAANEKIAERRQGLLAILDKLERGHVMEGVEKLFVEESARCYEMVSSSSKWIDKDPKKLIKALLNRVDVVPPSLAVAQAASESAWGGSRFASEGNNLFGQWSFTPAKGIVPAQSTLDKKFGLAKYPTIAHSVDSYLKNINTFSAYSDFRDMRAQLRSKGEKLDAELLAQGLVNYSTRGEEYVKDIRKIIRQNDLSRFDDSVIVPIGEESLAEHPGPIEEHLYNL